MQKVYINGRFLVEHITGIQRFAYEMCKAMIDNGFEIIILAPKKIRADYKLNCRIIQLGIFPGVLWEHLDLLFFLWRHKCPLLINFGSPGPLFYRNRIVSIHDITFYINPKWFSWWYGAYYRLITPIFTRLSKKVITVSKFSKSEIIKKLNIDSNKIIVINNAVSHDLKNSQSIINANNEKYILTVGSLDPRKNLKKLIEAYKLAGLENELKLIIVGKGSAMFNMELSEDIKNNMTGYVSDKELANLYSRATVFVYPSLYEGFGIPPLEAMSFGCPVVLSDIPVFREVFGDAACYVNPLSKESIAEGIQKVFRDLDYRKTLVERGYNKVQQYSWDNSAKKLIAHINSIL